MGLRARLAALERDLEQARRDAHLAPHWRHELEQVRAQLAQLGHVTHTLPLPRYGIDYAWGRPSIAGMHAHGVTFACRYLTGGGKALNRLEAQALSHGNIDIVSIFESNGRMQGGAQLGRVDAQLALEAARSIGMPQHRPIYFADDTGDERAVAIVSFLAGAGEILEPHGYQPALYGGREAVQTALAAGYTWVWQTLAWSRGLWEPRAQLRQTSTIGPTIDGIECDTDWAYAPDFGQWRL